MTESSVVPMTRPRPGASLVASARRITSKTITRKGVVNEAWQDDAWEMFDLVGEHRFLASTLAGRMAQARLYVGKLAEDPSEDPEPVEDPKLTGILEAIGDSAAARAQMVYRVGVNLFVPGDCWLAGIPKELFPEGLLPPTSLMPEVVGETDLQVVDRAAAQILDPNSIDIDDLQWRALSVSEVSTTRAGQVQLKLGEGDDDKIECSPDQIILVRVWRPHPRKAWQADSPTRSNLPVLRELVGLTMHVSAQVDSRLAGAGLLIVPQSAKRAMLIAAGLPEDSEEDPFTDALIDAMLTPIGDRANASAVVPLVITVPDDVVEKFKHLSFATPLDTSAGTMREEAIRRFALGSDAPPELLLGTAGMNHWGAWLVEESVVTTHLEPPLALLCDAITSQYLWPVLLDQGMTEEQAHQYVIWYDVSDLVVRPNRSQDAFALHAANAIDNAALRDATGFDQSDAPDYEDLPPEISMALELIKIAPSLANGPGLPQLVAQIRAVLNDDIPELKEPQPVPAGLQPGGADDTQEDQPEGSAGPPTGTIPQTDANPPTVPDMAASGGWGTYPSTPVGQLDMRFTPEQIVGAFEDVPGGLEFLDGFLAQAQAARDYIATQGPDYDDLMRETYGGPGSGRYPKGSGLHPKGGPTRFPQISRSQLSNPDTPRTRAVTEEEFQTLAATGRTELARMRANASPPRGLDENWDTIVQRGYNETRQPWGGATVDAHTGRFLEEDADVFVVTVKPPGVKSVTVSPDASPDEFRASMDTARQRFSDELSYENHSLGIFHDEDLGRIDIDPVLVLPNAGLVDTIGAYTHAVGGAYNPRTGDGYWPPYVGE